MTAAYLILALFFGIGFFAGGLVILTKCDEWIDTARRAAEAKGRLEGFTEAKAMHDRFVAEVKAMWGIR